MLALRVVANSAENPAGSCMATFADGADTDATVDDDTAAKESPAKEEPAASVKLCASPGCGKPATMACPNCLKLSKEQTCDCGFTLSLYCAQACFKEHWSSHKQVHKLWQAAIVAQKETMPPGFGGYTFTGALRPAPYGPSRMGTVPKSILYPDYAADSMPRGEINDKRANRGIPVYTPVEIEGTRNACRIGREVLDLGGRAVRAGATCDEIDRVVHEAGPTARARATRCGRRGAPCDRPPPPLRAAARARRLPSSAARTRRRSTITSSRVRCARR